MTKQFGLASLVIISLIICVSSSVHAELKVVTTFSILADFVQQVGGELVEVDSLVPYGSDPHHWEPTPREARSITAADVLFYNGLGLETWIDRLIANVANADLPIVVLSEGLDALPVSGASDGAHHHHDHDHALHGFFDPHMWLDVHHAIDYVNRITLSLMELDSKNAEYYQKRSDAYVDELLELDQWFMDLVAKIPEPNRKIITYHNAFAYLAKRYGLTVEAYLVVNPDREPSSRTMIELTNLLVSHPRKVIFTEPQAGLGGRYTDVVATEVGGTVYTLYSGSLTEEVPTYIEMMRHNGLTLLEALG